jgi:hypothetical protein
MNKVTSLRVASQSLLQKDKTTKNTKKLLLNFITLFNEQKKSSKPIGVVATQNNEEERKTCFELKNKMNKIKPLKVDH